MSVAAQLHTNRLLVNLDYEGKIVDLCWPDKAEGNIFLREWAGEILYKNGQLYNPEYTVDMGRSQLREGISYLSQANGVDIKLDCDVITEDSLVRHYQIKNTGETSLSIDLFTYTAADFGNNYSRDTAAYFPDINGIIHYEASRYLGVYADRKPDQYACQAPDDYNGRGAKPDRELQLTKNPISLGRVESSLKYHLEIQAGEKVELNIYYLLAPDLNSLMNSYLRVQKEKSSRPAPPTESSSAELINQLGLNAEEAKQFNLLVENSQYLVEGSFTPSGGTFAAIDSSFFKQGGVDDYSYFWPRDGAFIVMSLLKQPKTAESEQRLAKYFTYLSHCFAENPFLFIRYKLDDVASVASHWHAWVDGNDNPRLPIQLDETALSIVAYSKYLKAGYSPIQSMQLRLANIAEFLLENIDEVGLHKPCVDPWENDWGVFSSTQIAMIAALKELSYLFSSQIETTSKTASLQKLIAPKAEMMLRALKEKFLSPTSTILRGYIVGPQENLQPDLRADSLLHWAWYLNVLSVTDPLVKRTIEDTAEKLAVKEGYARYENDHYLQISEDYPGNPWYISTIWYCGYYLKTARPDLAAKAMRFVLSHMDRTTLLPEMANPDNGFALSVKPLIWSHAEVLNLLN